MSYVAGVFGGGIETIGIISDEYGDIIGRGKDGDSKYRVTGMQNAVGSIIHALEDAKGERKIESLDVLCLALPDIDTPEDEYMLLTEIMPLRIAKNILIYNDSVAVLMGAIPPEDKLEGVITIADIGSISFGMNEKGVKKRVGGWSYFLGDEGSSNYIGHEALLAAVRSHDGRGKQTRLKEEILKEFEMERAEDLLSYMYGKDMDEVVQAFVSASRVVFKCADEGDEVALDVLNKASKELALSTTQKNFELCVRAVGNVTGALQILNIGDKVGIRGPYGNGFDTDFFKGKQEILTMQF